MTGGYDKLGMTDTKPFYGAMDVKKIDLSGVQGMTTVVAGAFSFNAHGNQLSSLKEIILPKTVTTFATEAFSGYNNILIDAPGATDLNNAHCLAVGPGSTLKLTAKGDI